MAAKDQPLPPPRRLEEAEALAKAEGLQLLRSTQSNNTTGFKNVSYRVAGIKRHHVISKPYTKLNPPPWCYVNDKFINFDEFQHVVVALNNAVPTDDPARTVPISGAGDVKPERLDQFWNGPDADYPFTKDYMKRLGPNQGSRDVNFELERDKGWWTTHLKDAFTKFDANKDEHISEQEYLTAMGLGQLRGLPRKS